MLTEEQKKIVAWARTLKDCELFSLYSNEDVWATLLDLGKKAIGANGDGSQIKTERPMTREEVKAYWDDFSRDPNYHRTNAPWG